MANELLSPFSDVNFTDEELVEIYQILTIEKKLDPETLPTCELHREGNIISFTLYRIGTYFIDLDDYRRTGNHIYKMPTPVEPNEE